MNNADDAFMRLYRSLGLGTESGKWLPLHEACGCADRCWNGVVQNRIPSGTAATISRPWVGKDYAQTKILVLGWNMVDHGGYEGILDLVKSARPKLAEGKRRMFKQPGYGGTLVYHRAAAYAVALRRAMDEQPCRSEFPNPKEISEAWNSVAFTNCIKCSPKGDRSKPTQPMWEACGSHVLRRELDLLQPRVILLLGSHSDWYCTNVLQGEICNRDARGQAVAGTASTGSENLELFAVPHPTQGKAISLDVWNDLLAVASQRFRDG